MSVGCNVPGSSVYNSITWGKYGGKSLKQTSVLIPRASSLSNFLTVLSNDFEVILNRILYSRMSMRYN